MPVFLVSSQKTLADAALVSMLMFASVVCAVASPSDSDLIFLALQATPSLI